MSRTTQVFLVSLALCGVGLYLVGVATDLLLLRLIVKPLPVLALIIWVLRDAPDTTGRIMAAGLVLGLTGDVLLELGGSTFIAGLVAFLLGHVAYIVALSRAAGRLAPLLLVPLAAYGGVMAAILTPHLGELAVPVSAYLLVICGMAWRASALADARGGWAWAALGGALLFLFSDTLIALDRFVAPIQGARPAIMLTYWLAQTGLVAGVVLGRR
jgi:alkenylglycerophosphocholine/alkenylglycerophosphoethanolamine hydrolase